MLEILVVVVILAISAMLAVPMLSSAGSMQLGSAANVIAADLEYAKSMAISTGQNYSIVFDKTTESYSIHDHNDATISHPVKKGFDYIVDFSNNSRLEKVDIYDVAFDTTAEIKFDYLGSPYNANDGPLNSGIITLKVDQTTMTITVEPVTGYISITD